MQQWLSIFFQWPHCIRRNQQRSFLPTQSKLSKLKPSGGPWCTYRWPIQLIGRYDAVMSGWEVVITRKNENELSYQINDVILIDPGCTSVLPPWPISLSTFLFCRGKYDTFVNENLVHTYDNAGSFGELALMYNTPRAATIKAATEGLIWALVC